MSDSSCNGLECRLPKPHPDIARLRNAACDGGAGRNHAETGARHTGAAFWHVHFCGGIGEKAMIGVLCSFIHPCRRLLSAREAVFPQGDNPARVRGEGGPHSCANGGVPSVNVKRPSPTWRATRKSRETPPAIINVTVHGLPRNIIDPHSKARAVAQTRSRRRDRHVPRLTSSALRASRRTAAAAWRARAPPSYTTRGGRARGLQRHAPARVRVPARPRARGAANGVCGTGAAAQHASGARPLGDLAARQRCSRPLDDLAARRTEAARSAYNRAARV